MKLKTLLALAILATVTGSQAAVTVTAVNQDAGANPPSTFTGVPVVDNSGAPVAFEWRVGYFANGTDFSGDAGTLLATFQQNGGTGSSNAGIAGTFAAGILDAATSTDNTDLFTSGNEGGAFNVFYMIGDNPGDFDASTDFIIIDSLKAWVTEVPLLGATFNLNLQTEAYNLVRGSATTVASDGYSAPFTSFNNGSAITFVPEPSSTLLLGLGGLGLLIRRKR